MEVFHQNLCGKTANTHINMVQFRLLRTLFNKLQYCAQVSDINAMLMESLS